MFLVFTSFLFFLTPDIAFIREPLASSLTTYYFSSRKDIRMVRSQLWCLWFGIFWYINGFFSLMASVLLSLCICCFWGFSLQLICFVDFTCLTAFGNYWFSGWRF